MGPIWDSILKGRWVFRETYGKTRFQKAIPNFFVSYFETRDARSGSARKGPNSAFWDAIHAR